MHFIENEHIQSFLALETLNKIQKIEGHILLGEYEQAKALLPKESDSLEEQAPERLFDFSPTEKDMLNFLHQLWNEWSNNIEQFLHLKCQEFYLQKIIRLGDYLGKITEIQTYQLMVSHS